MRVYEFICDEPGCTVQDGDAGGTQNLLAARKAASQRGWLFTTGKDFCPKHAAELRYPEAAMTEAEKLALLAIPLSDDELEYVRELNRTADERTIADGGIPVSPGWMPRMIATVDHLTAQIVTGRLSPVPSSSASIGIAPVGDLPRLEPQTEDATIRELRPGMRRP